VPGTASAAPIDATSATAPVAPPGFPTPERSKPSPVPTNHGLRPDDGQRVYNARSEAIQPNQHQSVESAENKSLPGFAPQYIDLLSENQDFRFKPHSRAKQPSQRRPQQHEYIDHRA